MSLVERTRYSLFIVLTMDLFNAVLSRQENRALAEIADLLERVFDALVDDDESADDASESSAERMRMTSIRVKVQEMLKPPFVGRHPLFVGSFFTPQYLWQMPTETSAALGVTLPPGVTKVTEETLWELAHNRPKTLHVTACCSKRTVSLPRCRTEIELDDFPIRFSVPVSVPGERDSRSNSHMLVLAIGTLALTTGTGITTCSAHCSQNGEGRVRWSPARRCPDSFSRHYVVRVQVPQVRAHSQEAEGDEVKET